MIIIDDHYYFYVCLGFIPWFELTKLKHKVKYAILIILHFFNPIPIIITIIMINRLIDWLIDWLKVDQ